MRFWKKKPAIRPAFPAKVESVVDSPDILSGNRVYDMSDIMFGVTSLTVSAADARKLRVGQYLPGDTGLYRGRVANIEALGWNEDDWFSSGPSEYRVTLEKPWRPVFWGKSWLEDDLLPRATSFYSLLERMSSTGYIRDTKTGKTYQIDGPRAPEVKIRWNE